MPQADVQFLDTNIFLRYLTNDDPAKSQRAYDLLQRIEKGELTAITSEGVIAEIVFVLANRRTYARPRSEIRQKLSDLLGLRGLRLGPKSVYFRALELYELNEDVDFVDCLNVAHLEHAGLQVIWSFDRDYERMKGAQDLIRREP